MPRPPSPPPKTGGNSAGKSGAHQVWVLREGRPVALPVTAGASDGRMTEITGGTLEAGMQVITEILSAPR
jgi:HlyD family secretion protein